MLVVFSSLIACKKKYIYIYSVSSSIQTGFLYFFCQKSLDEGSRGRHCCHFAGSHVFAVPAPGSVFDFCFFCFLASGLRAGGKMVYERGYLRSSLALGRLLSARLAVFLKTMAGQAGESGSRGGKNHEFLNPIVGCFFFFLGVQGRSSSSWLQ